MKKDKIYKFRILDEIKKILDNSYKYKNCSAKTNALSLVFEKYDHRIADFNETVITHKEIRILKEIIEGLQTGIFKYRFYSDSGEEINGSVLIKNIVGFEIKGNEIRILLINERELILNKHECYPIIKELL